TADRRLHLPGWRPRAGFGAVRFGAFGEVLPGRVAAHVPVRPSPDRRVRALAARGQPVRRGGASGDGARHDRVRTLVSRRTAAAARRRRARRRAGGRPGFGHHDRGRGRRPAHVATAGGDRRRRRCLADPVAVYTGYWRVIAIVYGGQFLRVGMLDWLRRTTLLDIMYTVTEIRYKHH